MKLYTRGKMLYIYSNGVRTSTGLEDTKENRKEVLSKYKNDEFYSKFKVPRNYKTVIEYCEDALLENEKKLSIRTMKTYNSLFNSRIVPYFKGKYPHEINPMDIKNFYLGFTDKSTLNTCVNGILKKAFRLAMIDGRAKENPFIVDFPTLKSDYVMNPFNLEEVKTILDNTDSWFRNFLGVAFFSGARTGEIIALEWNDINFEDGTISISKTRSGGITGKPKTKASIRTIDMLPQCEQFLKAQQKITGLSTNVFYSTTKKNKEIHGSGSFFKLWKRTLEKCNLEYRSIYQTRHTFASNMLSNKEDIFWVSKTMGHKNINITIERYACYIRSNRARKTTFLDDDLNGFCTNLAQ